MSSLQDLVTAMENVSATLRPMQKADVFAIVPVQADLEVNPWSTKQWHEAYQHTDDAWVVVDKSLPYPMTNGLLIGYAIYQAVLEQAELLNFGIRKEYQGRGLGRDLLESTLSLLPDSVTEVLLDVRRSNVPARNLYTKVGFQEVAERRDYYPVAGGSREDAIIMKKMLPISD